MEPQRIIQSVLALYSVDEKTIGAALGVSLPRFRDNPYWAHYRTENVGVFSYVQLGLSKERPAWGLSFGYNLEVCSYAESSVDFRPYGPVVDVDVNPDIPPEGARTNTYHYSGYSISFAIAPNSRRILGGSIGYPLAGK